MYTVQWNILGPIEQSDCGYQLLFFTAVEKSNIGQANSVNYPTIGYRIKAAIYRAIGYRTHKKLSVAHLWLKLTKTMYSGLPAGPKLQYM
jgi:hypothetical protein